ncbi:MFS sugar transporter [Rhizoctonia solani]|uniref:Molybdate-anion transporter n=3 Tax=Rhizoctonia solani TaxID=456999 RepID=A0A8H7HAQ2_9AGAM|nr:MFS sugar transporter [Rhizoctonia solani]
MSWYPSHEPLIPLPSNATQPVNSNSQASSSQSTSLLDLISSSPLESKENPLFPERKPAPSLSNTQIPQPPSRLSDEPPLSPGFGDFVSVPPSADPLGDFIDFGTPLAERPLGTQFLEGAKARSAEKERQVMDEFRQAESRSKDPLGLLQDRRIDLLTSETETETQAKDPRASSELKRIESAPSLSAFEQPSTVPVPHADPLATPASASTSPILGLSGRLALPRSWTSILGHTILGTEHTPPPHSPESSPHAKPVRESSITHDNPFSHVAVPPSGAPGYTGEKWDKGFGDDVASKGSGSGLKLLGRTEMTTPILSVETAEKLRPYLPALRRLSPKWSLLYSLDQHGISLATFYTRCEQPTTGGCLVAIRDSEGATFGVWCGDGIRKQDGYAGTGESNGKFGLYLDSALLDGESASCPTFDNEPLCSGGNASSAGTVKYEWPFGCFRLVTLSTRTAIHIFLDQASSVAKSFAVTACLPHNPRRTALLLCATTPDTMLESFYASQLVVMTGYAFFAMLLENYIAKRHIPKVEENDPIAGRRPTVAGEQAARALSYKYLVVYGVVMAADWLQGPYVYSLYKDQYGYSERMVAILFVTGFLSAGLAAPTVGVWADNYGRKRICMGFCVSYAISCFCTFVNWLPVNLAGRVFGGISTSILFSCFDSWLVSAAQTANVSSQDLSSIFSSATLINGMVAAGMGVFSNGLVAKTQTFASPFAASALCLGIAWFLIASMWSENHGSRTESASADLLQIGRLKEAWSIVRQDSSMVVLGLVQTCFEGSMYLFVFLWVPSMQEAAGSSDLPLGIIFSAYMVSMMLGSLLYKCLVAYGSGGESTLVLHAKLSSLTLLTAAFALAVSNLASDSHWRFWAFCLFEACVGMYYPIQGMLRGTMIQNDHRATLSALFRVPLNIFVVVSLMSGVSSARHLVFSASTVSLAFGSVMTTFVIVKKAIAMEHTDTTRLA